MRMTTLAKYAYAVFSLNSKLHTLLDDMKPVEEHHAFSEHMDDIVQSISNNSRKEELSELKGEFALLENLYIQLKHKQQLSESATDRFDRIFESIKEKIKEKEV